MSSTSVLQVVLALSPGGTERLVIEMVKRLRGWAEIEVCCMEQRGDWASEIEALGISLTPLER